jgi:hypothetical protein
MRVHLRRATVPLTMRARAQDRVKAGVVALLARVAALLDADSIHALLLRLAAGLSTQSDVLQCALGAAVGQVIVAASLTDAQRREFVSRLLERVRPTQPCTVCAVHLLPTRHSLARSGVRAARHSA